jgi:hypothetical protein
MQKVHNFTLADFGTQQKHVQLKFFLKVTIYGSIFIVTV